jgi:hypothetical protein
MEEGSPEYNLMNTSANPSLYLLYTTVSNESEAAALATLVFTAKPAACVNIIASGRSICHWNALSSVGFFDYLNHEQVTHFSKDNAQT